MIRLSTSGKAHFALRMLADGPATMSEIRMASGLTGSRARKLSFLMGILRDRSLIAQAGPGLGYEITDAGREALAHLNGGADFEVSDGVPNVRRFASRQAA